MRLYKYVAPSTARTIISTKTLRWSSPMTLNDPFDMQFAFQFRVNQAKAIAMALEKGWQHHYGALLDRPLNELEHISAESNRGFPILRA